MPASTGVARGWRSAHRPEARLLQVKIRRRDGDPVGIGARRFEAPDLEALQSSDAGADRRGVATFEQVDAEVVVVSVPAHEPHHVTRLRHQLHAHGLVESLRAVEVCDVEVHVAQHRPAREFLLRLVRDSQQPFEVQVFGADVQAAVGVLPFASRPVRVDLDAVSLRIVEVERLADEMVCGAGQGQSLFEGPPQETAKLLLPRQEDREMVEAGCAPRSLLPTVQGFEAKQGLPPAPNVAAPASSAIRVSPKRS